MALARAVALLKAAVHRMRVPRDLKVAMVVTCMDGRIADVVLVSESHDSQASQHHHQNRGGGGLHRRERCRVEKKSTKGELGENEGGQSANDDGQRSRAFIVRDCRQ